MNRPPAIVNNDDTQILAELDMRIRAITTIIHKLFNAESISIPYAHPSTSSKQGRGPTAATSVATLLTRRAATNRNTNIGSSSKPIAVSTYTTMSSVDILAVTGHLIANLDETRSTDPSSNPSEPRFNLIEPFTGTLQEIATRDLEVDQSSIILAQHAADVIGVFNNYFQLDSKAQAKILPDMQAFIVRRCAPAISHRIRSYHLVFEYPLYTVLKEWTPSESDVLADNNDAPSPDTFTIGRFLHNKIKDLGIPWKKGTNGKFDYERTLKTASIWIDLLCALLETAEANIALVDDAIPDEQQLRTGTASLAYLSALVRSPVLKALFEVRSIADRLRESVIARRDINFAKHRAAKASAAKSKGDHTAPLVPFSDTQSVVMDDEDDSDNLEYDEQETPVSLTMQYLKNVLAWHDATKSLLRNKHFKKHRPQLTLRIMIPPSPPSPQSTGDVLSIFRAVAKKIGEDILEDDRDAYDAWLQTTEKALCSTRPFTGTIHCEAALMAAMLDPLVNDGRHAVARSFHFKSSITIGVVDKCCWCCMTLAKLSRLTGRKTFSLPPSHGRIVPWALPRGVPLEVAVRLEAELELALLQTMRREFRLHLSRLHEFDTDLSDDEGIDYEGFRVDLSRSNK